MAPKKISNLGFQTTTPSPTTKSQSTSTMSGDDDIKDESECDELNSKVGFSKKKQIILIF